MVKHIYKFDTVYEKPDEYIPLIVGRLINGKGLAIRIIFDKDGIKLCMPKACKSNGDIIFIEDINPGLQKLEG